MPRRLDLDFETFSEVDIREVGTYRYAFDPSTEILCAAMAFDDEEPVIWHRGIDEVDQILIEPYFDALRDPSVLIYAHNAMFESAICQALLMKTWGIPAPEISRFRCTMSLARRAALPAKLETLAEALKLGHQKDKRGKSLIKKFSMMQPARKPSKKNPNGLPPRRILPSDEPEAFKEFLEYCKQDVRAEQEVARKLAYFDDDLNNWNYVLDQRINARGVPVNLAALRHAQKLIDEETAIVSAKFRRLTGFEVTQNAKLLKWLHDGGVLLDDLQAETIESFLQDFEVIPDDVAGPRVKALRLKQSIAYASIKKVKTMLECAGPHDNRVRGLLNHHGAGTGRWTSSLVQFQNLKKATIKYSADAYREICKGISRDMLECCYGSVLEVISSSIRHFVHDVCPTCSGTGEGDLEVEGFLSCESCGGCETERPLLDADYAAVEARIVNWLAGQEDALERFRRYDAAKTKEEKYALDPYRIMASQIYGIPVDAVNKHPQRFVGKGCELGAGFGLGPPKFRKSCQKYGYTLPEGLEFRAIKTWRRTHKKTVQFWYDLENAAKHAILKKGSIFAAGKYIQFQCRDVDGMSFLLMRLPSGRKIAYPKPRLCGDRIAFFGNIPMTKKWGDLSAWGGVFANNCTQGTAADIMAHGAHQAEKNGYAITTLVHDQCLTYQSNGQTGEELIRLLTDLPKWASGLPLAAEGGAVPFYHKE